MRLFVHKSLPFSDRWRVVVHPCKGVGMGPGETEDCRMSDRCAKVGGAGSPGDHQRQDRGCGEPPGPISGGLAESGGTIRDQAWAVHRARPRSTGRGASRAGPTTPRPGVPHEKRGSRRRAPAGPRDWRGMATATNRSRSNVPALRRLGLRLGRSGLENR